MNRRERSSGEGLGLDKPLNVIPTDEEQPCD
jgi:hypothetical protein